MRMTPNLPEIKQLEAVSISKSEMSPMFYIWIIIIYYVIIDKCSFLIAIDENSVLVELCN